MARIENNVFLYGVAGMIGGQMVVRQTSQGGVMAVAPKPSDKQPTPAQQAQHAELHQPLAQLRHPRLGTGTLHGVLRDT